MNRKELEKMSDKELLVELYNIVGNDYQVKLKDGKDFMPILECIGIMEIAEQKVKEEKSCESLERIADTLDSIANSLDNIDISLSRLTDEKGIQYVKGEIAPCSY